MEERRTHPITIIGNMYRFLFLLVFPLFRGFLVALNGLNIRTWLEGAWFDILCVLIIVLFAVLKWRFVTYSINRKGLMIKRGLVVREQFVIPLKYVATMSAERLWWLKPFGAVRLRADTHAGNTKEADVLITVTKSEANRIMGYREPELRDKNQNFRYYRPTTLYIAALSAVTSNSFAGVVYISALISNAGSIIGEEFEQQLFFTLGQVSKVIAYFLPPFASLLAMVIIGGYAIAFLLNFIRHLRFNVYRFANYLYINSGFFTNRSYSVHLKYINYVDVRQSILTKMLQLYSVYVYCPGFGKRQEDVAAIVPAASKKGLEHNLKMLLNEFKFAKIKLRPNGGAIFKFIIDPLWPCVLTPLCAYLLSHYFLPGWADVINTMALMAAIPAYWWMAVRIIDFCTTGLGYENGILTMKYSSGYYLHTVSIPRDRIAHIHIRQSPIQIFDDSCDLLIFTKGEMSQKHHIKNLKRYQVAGLLQLDEFRK